MERNAEKLLKEGDAEVDEAEWLLNGGGGGKRNRVNLDETNGMDGDDALTWHHRKAKNMETEEEVRCL